MLRARSSARSPRSPGTRSSSTDSRCRWWPWHGSHPPSPSRFGLLATAAAAPSGERAYALEGSVAVTGSAIQWLRDGLGLIATAADTEPLARSVPDAGGVYFVPAFSGLFAPHW